MHFSQEILKRYQLTSKSLAPAPSNPLKSDFFVNAAVSLLARLAKSGIDVVVTPNTPGG